jgi:acetylornithine deacetylase/succinyl-diaminopimelate desuccinylase-like protein
LLLVTHLDTVDPGPPELWTETSLQPFALTHRGDRLFGLGTADTKLDALCKLMAAREFRGRQLRRSLELLGTFGEEVGVKGARHFVGTSRFQARFACCSEPSELVIIRAHKGYAVARVELQMLSAPELSGPFEEVTFEGKSAHSATPHLGVNAIDLGLTALGNMPFVSLQGGTVPNKVPARAVVVRPVAGPSTRAPESARRDASQVAALARRTFALWRDIAAAQEPKTNLSFDPPRSVVNWGVAQIQGSRASLTFDCRLLPGHDPDQLIRSFEKALAEVAASAGCSAQLTIEIASPAMELAEPSELLSSARAACRQVGLSDEPTTKPTNTEAGVFARAGAEAIVFGPGRSTGNAHSPNEHNLQSHLEKAIEFYRALIERLCG